MTCPLVWNSCARNESEIGANFTNPVLDTVLLSAIVFGQSATHRLDAISERLGIRIPPDARRTTMGEAIATADVFIKPIRMAADKGIVTFGDALGEMRVHQRLRQDANADHPS